ncbi:hypothetical protein Lal_00004227 [Lupinus albus]|nr:hypothetical protein Lal_00004227 [Lupinus albus]
MSPSELIPLISNDFSFPQYLHYISLLLLHATEEAAIIDLLNFLYTNTLGTTSPRAVLDVLMATDKFQANGDASMFYTPLGARGSSGASNI